MCDIIALYDYYRSSIEIMKGLGKILYRGKYEGQLF